MQLIDTHAHTYYEPFWQDPEWISRARTVLKAVFLPNVDLASIAGMHALADAHPGFLYPMMGLHPCDVKDDFHMVLRQMEALLGTRRYYGIGETGMDFYWDKTHVIAQEAALRIQAEWAKDTSLPLILHCRESMDEVIRVISEMQDGRLKGIFHCFTGTAGQARKVTDLGFLIGIGGVVTYKTSTLPVVLAEIGRQHLVLETDSPYLPPVPYRGKRNEPAYLPLVAHKLAEIFSCGADEIEQITNRNAESLFKI